MTKTLSHHHHHLSLNREGCWGNTDDFATSFLHFSLFSTALWDLANFRPVHWLMLSSYLFLCLPCLLPPFHCALQNGFGQTCWTWDMTVPLPVAAAIKRRSKLLPSEYWNHCVLHQSTQYHTVSDRKLVKKEAGLRVQREALYGSWVWNFNQTIIYMCTMTSKFW